MKDLAISLHQLFPLIIFFVVFPLVFYLSYRSQKKQKEAFKAIGLKLGLQFSESPSYHQIKARIQSDPDFTARYGQAGSYRTGTKPGYEDILQKVLGAMSPPALTGKYNGSDVRITLVRRDKTNYTEFRVIFSQPLGLGLKITAKNQLISKYLLSFKGREADAGQEAFYQRLKMQAKDSMKLKYLLTFERQRMLLDLFSENPSAVVDDEGITVSRRGFLGDYLQYRIILDKMTALSGDISRG